MPKTILITGATDGIGLDAAETLLKAEHHVILHGRSAQKMDDVKARFTSMNVPGQFGGYLADLSVLADVEHFAKTIIDNYAHLDVLINNAGVYKTGNPIASNGQDVRFVVNTLAPYLLTQRLLPIIPQTGRIINLSSAAQASVSEAALRGEASLSDGAAYAQSKLAITMWSFHMAQALPNGPAVIAVNPGSLLGTKMVKDGYGIDGKDIKIGSDILTRLALDAEFRDTSGRYFDNDIGQFGPPHSDALNTDKVKQVVGWIETVIDST